MREIVLAIANVRISLERDIVRVMTKICPAALVDHGFVNVSTVSHTGEGLMHVPLAGIAAMTDQLSASGATDIDDLWVQISKGWND